MHSKKMAEMELSCLNQNLSNSFTLSTTDLVAACQQNLLLWPLVLFVAVFSGQVLARPQYIDTVKQRCATAQRVAPVFNSDNICLTCHVTFANSSDINYAAKPLTAGQNAFWDSTNDYFCPTPLDPNSTYELYNPKAPPATTRKSVTHTIELIAEEKLAVVANGVTQQLWTYNGKVPGPVIRVRVGDKIEVHLVNPQTNQLPHSLDFHSSQVAWDNKMKEIEPGSEKKYEWTADYAGVWMYHCGSNPALHHIASGMYGMVIVEPREGLPKVDHEFALVQSEFYTGAQGEYTSLDHAMHSKPDYVVFNGVAFQYKDHPIEVKTGSKVRFFVLNAGPSEDSSFHVVGTIFHRVIKEGVELTPHNKGHYGSQAVDLAPAQGAIIELTTKEDGLYPIVTHAFNFVGKGAMGLLKSVPKK